MNTKVALTRCSSYDPQEVNLCVNKAVDLLGGIHNIIKPNSKVLIKPNLLTDSKPEDCVTTHPRVIEAVILLAKKTNADIYVGDSPSVIGRPKYIETVFENTGMKDVCRRQDVKLVYFDKAIMKNNIPITEFTQSCDYIINVPKFKTHTLTVLTGAIKNLFGMVVGMHKAKIHRDSIDINEFSKRIVDVFQVIKPTLTIVDAVVSLEGEGPGSSGEKTDTEFILASQDAVALDSVLAVMMGLFPKDIPTTKEAARRNLGESDIDKIDILGERLGEFIFSNFKLPRISFIYKMPKPLLKLAKRLAWYKMQVLKGQCQSCNKCIEVCPVATISLEDKKAFINNKGCILCSCCQEICPYKAIELKKSPLLKILGV